MAALIPPKSRAAFRQYFLDVKLEALKPQKPIATDAECPLEEVALLMHRHNIGSILLVDDHKHPTGIISERVILEAIATHKSGWKEVPVRQYMTAPILSVRNVGSIGRAIFEMANGKVRHLVVDAPGQAATGIISIRDVLQYVYHALTKELIKAPPASELNPSTLEALLQSPVQTMSPNSPITVSEGILVSAAIERMHASRIGSVLVTNPSGALRGIFTERDIIHRVVGGSKDTTTCPLGEVMTPSPRTVLQGSSVALALSLMFEGGFRHVPIVDLDESLVGMLSLKNFLTLLSTELMKSLD